MRRATTTETRSLRGNASSAYQNMNHDLNTRMNHLRAALSDPRLTNRQQKMLCAIGTFMPFEIEDGWRLETAELCRSVYFGKHPTTTSLRNTRTVIKELEDAGMIERFYAPGRIGMQSPPTIFVNWHRLQEPYRTANPAPETPAHPEQPPLLKVNRSSLSTHKYPDNVVPFERKATN